MLSLTKKSDATSLAAPPWHPNFRNFERLPDTKVVRTAFFINTAAVVIAASLLMVVGKREYTLANLREQKARSEQEIAANSRQNKEAIRLSGLFAAEQKKLTELEAFVASPIRPLDFVTTMSRTLPKEVALDSIDARYGDASALMFTVRGKVIGTPDQATGTTSSYVETLKNDPVLGKIFDPITLTSINRDPVSGMMVFEIVFKGAKGK